MGNRPSSNLLRSLEVLTEIGIVFMVIFGPWAFGTTQDWAIELMNVTGLVLGALWLLKVTWRRILGYESPYLLEHGAAEHWGRTMNYLLATLTVMGVGYCVISAWNARAIYDPGSLSLIYLDAIRWLPHSYDQKTSVTYLRMYLALALVFWAVRDWILNDPDLYEESDDLRAKLEVLPPRLRRLLWIICLNGALVALVGIIQRVDGTPRLLWLVEPRVNKEVITFFGPYAYRANAAQYCNLIWPVALGLWWSHERARKSRRYHEALPPRTHHILFSCFLLLAVAPFVSTSRGGAIIMASMGCVAVVVLIMAQWRGDWVNKVGVFFLMILAMVLALMLGWEELGPRLEMLSDGIEGRETMFDTGRVMADNHPVFGTGPGTFSNMFHLYRRSNAEYWPAQMHNDWLELLITFGKVGSSIILAMLAACLLRWFAPGGIHGDKYFVMLLYCSLAGCLLHARYDFPFQIHSILTLFIILCAVMSSLTRHRK